MHPFLRAGPAALALTVAAAFAAGPGYHVEATIDGPPGSFDYLAVDEPAQRLFVARGYGVMAVDLATGHVVPQLVAGRDDSAVLPIPGTREALSTNWGAHTATIFDRATGRVRAVVRTGRGPDAAVYDAAGGRAYVMNSDSHDVSVIDVAAARRVGTIPLAEKPEAAVLDGHGHLYVNLEKSARIAIVDIATGRVTGRHALPACVEPTGLAYDPVSGLLIAACHNGLAKLIDARSGEDRGAVAVGCDADGAIFDPQHRRAFIPAADGTLTIFDLDETGHATVLAHLATVAGARTAALDASTGRVYLATNVPGTGQDAGNPRKPFRILVVAP